MKRVIRVMILALAVLMMSQLQVTVSAAKPEQTANGSTVRKRGLKLEQGKYYYYRNGRRIKSQWRKINKRNYYFGRNGAAYTGVRTVKKVKYLFDSKGRQKTSRKTKVYTVGGEKYLLGKGGVVKTGWHKYGKNVYYFDTKTGRMVKGRRVDGIILKNNGAARITNSKARLKLQVLNTLARITNDDMSRAQKLRACFNYASGRSFSYTTWRAFSNYKGWEADYAYEFLKYKRGNCYNFAAGFGYLAKELGYKVYVIRGRVRGSRDGSADGYTRHSWVKVNGLHYDPEAQFAGWYKGLYGSSSYPLGYAQYQNKI